MKRWIVTGALVLSMTFTWGLGSNALADGRAAGMLVSTADGFVVALVDFNEAQFTLAEADDLSGLLQFGAGILLEMLQGQAPGVDVNVIVVTPSQMIEATLGDADVADSYIRSNTLLGADLYVKAVATKVNPPQGAGVSGQNIRLDLFVIIPGVIRSMQYVGALEVQKQLIDLLGAF